MKKITLLFCLALSTMGYSQSLPFDFSVANQLMPGGDCITSLTTDAGNPVMQVIGSGALYDNALINFSANLNLSDNANNTITFRIKPINGTGSGSHLLKFENGVAGPAQTELPFTTTGTGWQNISINFGAGLGNYGTMVIFTDFNNNAQDTYLIDDIAGATNIVVVPLAMPTTPAPTPTRLASDVVSMYSEAYPNTFQYSFGSATDVDLDNSAAINNALKINLAAAGFGAGYNQTNVSSMEFVHFDYWTPNATTFSLYLISNGPVVEKTYNLPTNQPIVLNAWTGVDIPLSYFTALGFNPVNWFQYKFDNSSAVAGTIYFDNVYFWKAPLGISSFEKSNIKMYPNPAKNNVTIEANTAIEKVSVYNVIGQEVMTSSSTNQSITLDVSNLQVGIYVVKTTIDGAISTSRFVKE
jgi:Secretion system C-terminal sorting domain